jgi:hypothetical protein
LRAGAWGIVMAGGVVVCDSGTSLLAATLSE